MPLAEIALVIIAALCIDYCFGEPPRRIHPTVWMGRLVAYLTVTVKSRAVRYERAAGAGIVAALVAAVTLPYVALYALAGVLEPYAGTILITVSGVIVLAVCISVRSMLQHVSAVITPLECGDLGAARQHLATVVKRSTGDLDRGHILSGLVETISENTVDAIISPISYYVVAGIPGALAYRAINTIDAMIGYKTREFSDLGWFGAGCDRVLNYVPARICAVLMIAAAAILGLNWRGSLRVTRRDHSKTASPNAGYPMAAVAGALGVRLEKVGEYVIGEGGAVPTLQDVHDAKRIMIVSTMLYVIAISVSTIALLTQWWPANV